MRNKVTYGRKRQAVSCMSNRLAACRWGVMMMTLSLYHHYAKMSSPFFSGKPRNFLILI